MTVSSTVLKSGPDNTDGTTKTFGITFQYLAQSDVVVTLLNVATGVSINGILNTDFTIADNVFPVIGGTVTIANNAFSGIANATGQIPAGYTVTRSRNIPFLQAQSYPNAGLFPSAAAEQGYDRLTLICQQLELAVNSSLQIPVSDSSAIITVLPSAALRAGKLLGFDGSGNPIASSGTGSVVISTAMTPVVQAATTFAGAQLLLNGNIPSLAVGYADTNVLEELTASVNSYAQQIVQNKSNGATASADMVVSNDVSTATTFYGNFGMNSSGFTGSGNFNKASAVYLTSTSGDLAIGTTTANAIHFVYNSGTTDAAFIDSTGFNIPTAATETNSTVGASTAAAQNKAISFGSGFVNKFRNPGCTVAQRGTSGTVAAGNTSYTLDGQRVSATGAGIVWGQGLQINRSHNCLQLTGQAGVTNGKWSHRIESYDSASLAGQRVTFQAFINNSSLGVTLAPTLTVNYATAQDNFGAVTNIINAVAVQTIANGASGVVAYTFDVPNLGGASGAANGLEFILDFGNALNGAARIMYISDFDIRPTPNATTSAINTNPPPVELRPMGVELAYNQRFFYSTFANGVTPAQNVGTSSAWAVVGQVANGNCGGFYPFPVRMRAIPSVTTYSPNTASANWSSNGTQPTESLQSTNEIGVGLIGITSVTQGNYYSIHATATAEL